MPLTRLSSKGQVVLPKAVREALGLEAGDELRVEVEGDTIRLVPRRKRSLGEVLDTLPGHVPKEAFSSPEALLAAEREEARKRWHR
ncbi:MULTISPECIES: AbrB/MazE/SpoVT family DNA-binding domain-containing protein [unclassified Meiothermus]|uniref:AbrB/MazE/SpoVT family DNA-binding domain-containing protein n=1 Tax=unclassified Meiothermus TaxID=370471 RepID=UPI000D7CFE51|nr:MULTISPECIES: AbrB/MazE/SpoVT family DNA-binding domain-containing protein [unclassified Meiothermus]PZA06035.1 hypothetical protein DNA98_15360 [Meiothermus sp. Pnk-1]RYM36169.1 AbrB/MazE/SpoVT family DNA-binding domain-containing protein [Meiothermus sp. PNK-Is4]